MSSTCPTIRCRTSCAALEHYPDIRTTIATREEEAFGIAAGLYLGGVRPAVMLQSSGLGNSLNALTSFVLPYQVPMLILISMRGEAGEWNAAQVPMGRAVVRSSTSIGIPHVTVESGDKTGGDGRARRRGTRSRAPGGACLLPRRMTVPRPVEKPRP